MQKQFYTYILFVTTYNAHLSTIRCSSFPFLENSLFTACKQHVKLATLHWKYPINCNKKNFTKLFKESWESLTKSLITTGFRKCGIVPLNRNAIDEKRLVNSTCQDSLTNTRINDILVSSSNNPSLLNATTPAEFSVSCQSSNTPPNPLVAKKEETQRRKPRLSTQARLITSDEKIRQYEGKVEKVAKKRRKKMQKRRKTM